MFTGHSISDSPLLRVSSQVNLGWVEVTKLAIIKEVPHCCSRSAYWLIYLYYSLQCSHVASNAILSKKPTQQLPALQMLLSMEEAPRSVPVWIFNILPPRYIVSSAIGTSHLFLVDFEKKCLILFGHLIFTHCILCLKSHTPDGTHIEELSSRSSSPKF